MDVEAEGVSAEPVINKKLGRSIIKPSHFLAVTKVSQSTGMNRQL
jgi:hypothetical protein